MRRPTCFDGALLGNGRQGLMVWLGDEHTLNVTFAIAGFWIHSEFSTRHNTLSYAAVRSKMANASSEATSPNITRHDQRKSFQLGGGRLTLRLQRDWRFAAISLDLDSATVRVSVNGDASEPQPMWQLVLTQCVDMDMAHIACEPASLLTSTGDIEVSLHAAYEFVKDALSATFPAPQFSSSGNSFTQCTPLREASLEASYTLDTERGRISLETQLTYTDRPTNKALASPSTRDLFWPAYWRSVPTLCIPDEPLLADILRRGLYLQASTTPAHARSACTLQGVFLEDFRVPPWSCDYHFNVNLQMVYLPALATGQYGHFEPLWRMFREWMPRLRRHGQSFFGVDDAILLPHAVDDRCETVDQFWTGSIDQGCVAWMAHLAWLYVRFTGDTAVLDDIAWPLLTGAFGGFYAMLEEEEDCGVEREEGAEQPLRRRLYLPVSVSPEYNGSRMSAIGANASFQLAALHMLCRVLPLAAQRRGCPVDARWRDVQQRLASYSLVEAPDSREEGVVRTTRRIGLWRGKDLEDSHRHHSHLAGIYPFTTIDVDHERELVEASLLRWTRAGYGAWSGWSFPWAASINARVGRARTAIAQLRLWNESFVSEHSPCRLASFHDATLPGLTVFCRATRSPVFQLDAAMGALSAVLDLCVHTRADGALAVFPSDVSTLWPRGISFTRVRVPGGFELSASVARRKGLRVELVCVHPLVQSVSLVVPQMGALAVSVTHGSATMTNSAETTARLVWNGITNGDSLIVHTQ